MSANLSSRGIFVDPLGPREAAKHLPHLSGLRFLRAAAEPWNLCRLFRRGGLGCPTPGEPNKRIDVLKVDVDGCDCSLAAATLRLVLPLLVFVEINHSFPPPLRFSRQCHPKLLARRVAKLFGSRSLSTMGCSLSAAAAMFREEGFSLVRLSGGNDAVFAHSSIADMVGGGDVDELACFHEAATNGFGFMHFLRWSYMRDWAMRLPEEALGLAWCNVTAFDWLEEIHELPFSLTV
eukprot:gnl/TRDRNA2_/TRDRNA2_165905_c0_seq3.p1 gnl/TRDRNA2_/TRDRNA2_165905_c0~~gnl/TRDRNA2_/TRDRNA2_165905_c0_seq3.p1  ORF type:complete len:267 (-),score=35.92 gnl/TRDRNA2_/TRDRNA2_165905_c0_seq3:38-742(-)